MTDARCSFTFGPTDADGHGVPDTEWACHRTPEGDADLCVFHLDPEERRERGISAEDVGRRFVEAVTADGRRCKEFVGCRFERLDLNYQELDSSDNYPIDLRHARVDDVLVLEDSAVSQPLLFDGAHVGELRVASSNVDTDVQFRDATFDGDVHLETAFDGRVDFSGATFHGDVELDEMVFNSYVYFADCTFDGSFDCYVDFNDEPHFTGATFHGDADFFMDVNADSYFDEATFGGAVSVYAEFNGDAYFDGTVFEGPVEAYGHFNVDALFRETRFEDAVSFRWRDADLDSVRFNGTADFEAAVFAGPAEFGNVEFIGAANFTDATFRAAVTFDDARFERVAEFSDVGFADRLSLAGAIFERRLSVQPSPAQSSGLIDLSRAELARGTLDVPQGSRLVYDLASASVGEVTFDDGASLEHYRVFETDFDGFDFSRHRGELVDNGWTIHTTVSGLGDEAEPRRLEATYLKAKNGANTTGENKAASEFFRRELQYRRRGHRADLTGAPPGSIRWWTAGGRYLANLTMATTCGYGEKPWRVVASSFGIIVVFAALYRLVDVYQGGDDTLLRYGILSLETFVSLVLGSPEISDPLVNLFTALEAFLGAYFIALFVFTLTRSIHR
jgi:uncharacterized protein YjbI with pentapeptide repeats